MPKSTSLTKLANRISKLEKTVLSHDRWARDYNDVIEMRNLEVMRMHEKQNKDHEEWKAKQTQAVVKALEIFYCMEAKLDAVLAEKEKAHGNAEPSGD